MIPEIGELLAMYAERAYTRGGLVTALMDLMDQYPVDQVIAEMPEPWRSELVAWGRAKLDNDEPLAALIRIGGSRARMIRTLVKFRNWLRGVSPPVAWNHGRGLGTWSYTLPGYDDETPPAALERYSLAVLAPLASFAVASGLRAVTEEHGDDGVVIDGPIDERRMRDAFARGQHVIQVELALDLALVFGDPPTEQALPRAARLWLENNDELHLLLSIDTDIYAPVEDNADLASLNGPRLEDFLAAVIHQLGGCIDYIEGFAELM